MRYRRIDNGDYVMGNGKYDFVTDLDAFVQAVKTKLLLYQGEWWEDLTEGLPFFQEVAGQFIKNDEDKDLITQIYLNRVSEVQGFRSVIDYTADFENEKRQYSLSANVDTNYGIAELEVI